MELYNTREEIDKGINLNLVNTSKFKTNLISIYFIRPLIRNEATQNALIPLILRRGTMKNKTAIEIQRKLEELYGSSLSISVSKKGERQIIRFTIEGPSSQFVDQQNFFKEKLKMLYEIISEPLLEGDGFLSKYVEQEKKNLKDRIDGRINDKKQYAVDRCIEEMCEDENFSIYKYGYVEDLERINSKDVYKHYRTILETSPIEISVVGNLEKDMVINKIKDVIKFERKDIINIPREEIVKTVKKEKRVFEKMDINQGKLSIGYRNNIPYEDRLYVPFLIASEILGGGPNSKLFLNVREKESLAYYIYTKSYKYKSLMQIAAGIESKNLDKTLDIISRQIEEMKNGIFEEKDIEQSKSSIITSIRTMTDSNFSLSEFYLSQSITNESRSIEDLIERIRAANKGEIVEAANKITLDTIYFLSNDHTNEEE